MNIIRPISIDGSMIGVGTSLAEDSTPAWASGGTYAVGDERHLAITHRVYRCAVATSGSTVPPNQAITNWVDVRPTNKWAPFDFYVSTAASATTSLSYVLSPGYFNALAIYGVVADAYSVTIKSSPGGAVIYSKTGVMSVEPDGWYEYLFGGYRPLTRMHLTGLPLSPTAELTVTLTASSGAPVALGMLVVGDYKSLIDSAEWGGPQRGSSAEPVTYSYISTADDGTVTIKRRHSATNLRIQVVMPVDVADMALAAIQDVLDVPVAVITSDKFTGLNTFGLLSGSVSYDGPSATANLTVKGLI